MPFFYAPFFEIWRKPPYLQRLSPTFGFDVQWNLLQWKHSDQISSVHPGIQVRYYIRSVSYTHLSIPNLLFLFDTFSIKCFIHQYLIVFCWKKLSFFYSNIERLFCILFWTRNREKPPLSRRFFSDFRYRLAEMHKRICHALHDVHLAARMLRAFLNKN